MAWLEVGTVGYATSSTLPVPTKEANLGIHYPQLTDFIAANIFKSGESYDATPIPSLVLVLILKQPDGKVPNNFAFLQLGIIVDSKEALSFELEPTIIYAVPREVLKTIKKRFTHLGILVGDKRVRIQLIQEVVEFVGIVAREQRTVQSHFAADCFLGR